MTIELINQTNNANIYGIYDNNLAPIGTVQVILSGRDCGTNAYTLTGKYTRKQILDFYRAEKKKEKLFNEL